MAISLKVEALSWLRYSLHLPWVATEAGYWNADVLGADDKRCIEVEVKRTRADFLADFNKEWKHATYKKLNLQSSAAIWSPTQFYYLMPAEIGDSCLQTLNERGIKYAGLAVLDQPTATLYSAGKHVRVLKRAPTLHKNKPHAKLIRSLSLRMGSEIATLRLTMEMLKGVKPETVDAIVQESAALAKSLVNTEDWEKNDEDAQRENSGSSQAEQEGLDR